MYTTIYGTFDGDSRPINVNGEGNIVVSPMSVTTVHYDNVTVNGFLGNGKIAEINGLKTIAIQTFGTADNLTIVPYLSIDGEHWKHVCVISHHAIDGGTNFGYLNDIAGWKYLKCEIEFDSSYSTAGTLSVISNAIY